MDSRQNAHEFTSRNTIEDVRTEESGIWIIDSSAKTVFANQRMAEILGATVLELMGQHSFDYLFPEDVAAAARLFESKKRGDTSPFRFRLRRRDGSPTWVEVQGTPMHDATGMTGIVGTFNVISEEEMKAGRTQVTAMKF
jgi:PAS domain S-box-containing protein